MSDTAPRIAGHAKPATDTWQDVVSSSHVRILDRLDTLMYTIAAHPPATRGDEYANLCYLLLAQLESLLGRLAYIYPDVPGYIGGTTDQIQLQSTLILIETLFRQLSPDRPATITITDALLGKS